MNKKKLISLGTTLCLAVALAFGMQVQAKAENTTTKTYQVETSDWETAIKEYTKNTYTYYDEEYDPETGDYVEKPYTEEYTYENTVVRYPNTTEFYVDTATVNSGNYSYYGGGATYTGINVSDSAFTIKNIRCSNKNIKVALTATKKYRSTYNADYISAYYISYFAKKSGKAIVSFDVYRDGKFITTGSIQVTAKQYTDDYKPVVKSVKYAGKDLYSYYPFATKTSGKLKVTAAKGYKIKKIEYSTGYDAKKGEYKYKKIKNNGTIKLIKSRKYTKKYNEGKEYEYQYSYNDLFPTTLIRITLQNKKTKETVVDYEYLYTLNTK